MKIRSRKQTVTSPVYTRSKAFVHISFVWSINKNHFQNNQSLLKFTTMKKTKIIYWTTTVIIFLFEGVMPALTFQTELAKEGIRHLGYPQYFGNAFVVFKVLGALALVIHKIPNRIKEWAYAGFAFDFIFACISHGAVDGFGGQTLFPLLVFAILITSYISHEKLKKYPNPSNVTFKTKNHVFSSILQ